MNERIFCVQATIMKKIRGLFLSTIVTSITVGNGGGTNIATTTRYWDCNGGAYCLSLLVQFMSSLQELIMSSFSQVHAAAATEVRMASLLTATRMQCLPLHTAIRMALHFTVLLPYQQLSVAACGLAKAVASAIR